MEAHKAAGENDTGPAILRDLGDSLVLRRATPADAGAVAAFMGEVFREPGATQPDVATAAWTRDLLSSRHPTFAPGDFTIVEDTRTGAVVSALCLIPQIWTYAGIPFAVGRPELVGTHPDYRRRGLVRAQFAVIHEWSAARGQQVQAITGIPWYYRQFGYELALPLHGGRTGYPANLPRLPMDQPEPYHVRPAAKADLPFIADLYHQGSARDLVACVRDATMWQYEWAGRDPRSIPQRELRVIETAIGEPVGFLAHPPQLWDTGLAVTCYELRPGISWLAVTPSVLRYLAATGTAYAAREAKEWNAFTFVLGSSHPAYTAIVDRLPHGFPPSAWYIRVPDLPGFLRQIAPALEVRLAASPLAGHTGELRISFYTSGLRLGIEAGRLAHIEPWQPEHALAGEAHFPGLTFLQLMFGYRTLDELDFAFADCWANPGEARALLEALFPRHASNVWPIG